MSKNRDLSNYGNAALLDAATSTIGNTVVKRTAEGRVKTTNATESNDAVAFGQLGTASQANLTTGNLDATAGRVLKNGDFGWGGTVPNFVGSIDAVNIPSGFYLVAPANEGSKPPGSGSTFGFLQTINLGDRNRQIWYDTSANPCFTRQYNPGLASWTNWDTFTFRGEFGLGGINPYKHDWNVGNITQFFTQSVPTNAMDGENSDGNWWHILKLMSPNTPMGAIALKTHRAGGFPMVPELWTAQLNPSTGAPERFSRHYHTNNAVGTVVNPNFAPRGALIELGSNGNGQYVRYADGTQICWVAPTPQQSPVNVSYNNGFRSNLLNWTYPAAFASPPVVHGYARDVLGHVTPAGDITSTYMEFMITSFTSTGTPVASSLHAIGRWYQ